MKTQADFHAVVSPSARAGTRWSRKRGNVLVTMALGIVALLGAVGLGVDYAMLTFDASRLQQSCDYAALAGALQLKKTPLDGDTDDNTNAQTDALLVADSQMAALQAKQVTFSNGNTRIRVQASFTRQHFFMQLLGRTDSTITRHATSEASVIAGLPGVAPLAITTTDYDNYKNGNPLTVRMARNQDEAFEPGDVLGMSTDINTSKPVSHWEQEVKTGLQNTTRIGQDIVNSINADTRNQGRRLADALKDDFDSRMERAETAPWNDNGSTYTYPNYPFDSPRVMTIMVTDPKEQFNGTSLFVIRRLIPVYLEDAYNSSGENYMRVRILPYRAFNSDTPGVILGGAGAVNSGLYLIRLIDDLTNPS